MLNSINKTSREFKSLSEFWPFYLSQHQHPWTKALHVVGICAAALIVIFSILTGSLTGLWLVPVAGYLPAWIAHFFIEKNKPATFKNPFYSLVCDFRMCGMILLKRDILLQRCERRSFREKSGLGDDD